MKFKIITAAWNCEQYVDRCIESVEMQTHRDFDVCMVDDASDDNTGERITGACIRNDWLYMRRPKRVGACQNQYEGLLYLGGDPEDVIVFLDADDRLAHPHVLEHLVDYYSDGTLVTWGSYDTDPPSPTCSMAGPYPPEVVAQRSFRDHSRRGRGIPWNHLRTFKWKVFERMNRDDFIGPDGRFYQSATDAAFMYPALEIGAPYIKYIPEVLCTYTSDNPLADWRTQPRQCDRDHQHILRRPPKEPLT